MCLNSKQSVPLKTAPPKWESCLNFLNAIYTWALHWCRATTRKVWSNHEETKRKGRKYPSAEYVWARKKKIIRSSCLANAAAQWDSCMFGVFRSGWRKRNELSIMSTRTCLSGRTSSVKSAKQSTTPMWTPYRTKGLSNAFLTSELGLMWRTSLPLSTWMKSKTARPYRCWISTSSGSTELDLTNHAACAFSMTQSAHITQWSNIGWNTILSWRRTSRRSCWRTCSLDTVLLFSWMSQWKWCRTADCVCR